MLVTRMRKQFKESKIKMMQENPVVVNNSDGKEIPITGLVEFYNFDKGLACCFDDPCYCLKACIIGDDGKLHCSILPIGRVLYGAYPNSEQLKQYNQNCVFDTDKIKCIHLPNGRKVYPAK